MTTPTAATLVAEAKNQIENLTPEQVAKELEQGSVVVDLRESDELRSTGKIPGAAHIPRGMLEFAADPASPYHQGVLDPSKRVVLHCAAGGRSALAAMTLKQMGYTDVAHLDGGISAWTSEGRPTEPV
jgi:rhodanese-related sulfurtransferase